MNRTYAVTIAGRIRGPDKRAEYAPRHVRVRAPNRVLALSAAIVRLMASYHLKRFPIALVEVPTLAGVVVDAIDRAMERNAPGLWRYLNPDRFDWTLQTVTPTRRALALWWGRLVGGQS